jgi:hypothetical protein
LGRLSPAAEIRPVVKIDFLAWETEAWARATQSFLQLLAEAVPKAEAAAIAELDKQANEDGWDPGEHEAVLEALREQFRHWLPIVSAYSAVVLLHSIVETQLVAYAKRLRKDRNLQLKLSEIRGQGVQAARTYITKVAGVPIAQDPGWHQLENLQALRNIIVHRRGRQGADSRQRDTVRRLVAEYSDDLRLTDAYSDC